MNIFLRIHQEVIDCVFQLQGIDAQANRCGALRIKINNENTTSIFSERGCKIDGCRRLSNPTFLVTHRNNACGSMPGQWCRDGEIIFFVGRKIPGKRWLRWIRHALHLSALLHTIPPYPAYLVRTLVLLGVRGRGCDITWIELRARMSSSVHFFKGRDRHLGINLRR